MIDIVGEAGQARTSRLTQLSSMLWTTDNTQTRRQDILTGQVAATVGLNTIGEERPDDIELSCVKTNDNTPGFNNRDHDHERTAPTKNVVDSVDPLTSPA